MKITSLNIKIIFNAMVWMGYTLKATMTNNICKREVQ